MKIGVLVNLDNNIEQEIKKVHDLGFSSCQLSCWNMNMYSDEIAQAVIKAGKEYGVTVSTVWGGWQGPGVWDFYDGPATLGLVPVAYRYDRIRDVMKASDFAKKSAVKTLQPTWAFSPKTPIPRSIIPSFAP